MDYSISSGLITSSKNVQGHFFKQYFKFLPWGICDWYRNTPKNYMKQDFKIHNRKHFYSLCSVDSTDPCIDSIDLVDSIDPVDSIDLVDYIDPIDLINSIDPIDSFGPVDSIDPIDSFGPVGPIDPIYSRVLANKTDSIDS